MKKRVMLVSLLGTIIIGFLNMVGAYNGFGGYGFSLSNFLYRIDSSTLILFILFIIFFAILHNLVFLKFFRRNRTVSAIVSFCVSLLAVYGINTAQWDMGGLFYGLGISEDALFLFVSIFLAVILIYAIVKRKLGQLLTGLGTFLVILALFTNLIYEKGVAIIIGALLLIIGIWLWNRRKNRERERYYGDGGYPSSPRRRAARKAIDKYKDWRDPEERLRRYDKKERRLQAKEAAQLAKHAYRDRKSRSQGLRAARGATRSREKLRDIKRLRKIYRGEETTSERRRRQREERRSGSSFGI